MRENGWEALAARARGLATHLLTPQQVQELARMSDIPALARALEERHVIAGSAPSPLAIEVAMRRAAAHALEVLWHWADTRQPLLAPLLEEEDRRSVRALLRGAAAGAAPASRLAGLIPTPTLPAAALEELAAQATPAEVGTLLRAWSHPFGVAVTAGAAADLFATECAVDRLWAERAAHALRLGPTLLHEAVALLADIANAGTALTLATHHCDCAPSQLFVPGGASLPLGAFEHALEARGRVDVADRLAEALEPPSLAAAVRDASLGNVTLEDGTLRVMLHWASHVARTEPIGPAPVLHYLWRLRAQLRDVQLLAWRIALGAPPPTPRQLLVAA